MRRSAPATCTSSSTWCRRARRTRPSSTSAPATTTSSGSRLFENGSNCAVLGITASPQEYDDYVELLIKNPRLGHTYKAYFGDIYQLDSRLLPQFDYVSLFHVGEFRTPENDTYGALTDLEMTLMLADKIKPGGEVLFYSGSFAYDKAEAVGKELAKLRPFEAAGEFKSLRIFKKRAL